MSIGDRSMSVELCLAILRPVLPGCCGGPCIAALAAAKVASPAVGRAPCELICEERFVTLDLSRLGPQRLAENRPIIEENVV